MQKIDMIKLIKLKIVPKNSNRTRTIDFLCAAELNVFPRTDSNVSRPIIPAINITKIR